jgi:hypothetical protein
MRRSTRIIANFVEKLFIARFYPRPPVLSTITINLKPRFERGFKDLSKD